MAEVKFNKNKFSKEVRNLLKDAPLDRIGRLVIQDIKTKVRSGISPVTGQPIPDLAPSTIMRKDKLSQVNATSPFYRFGESNLTFTGQLLNALRSEVKEGSVRIFTEPSQRRPLTGLRKPRLETTDNQTVQEQVEAGDVQKAQPPRPYLGISKDAQREVRNIISNFLATKLRKLNNS